MLKVNTFLRIYPFVIILGSTFLSVDIEFVCSDLRSALNFLQGSEGGKFLYCNQHVEDLEHVRCAIHTENP